MKNIILSLLFALVLIGCCQAQTNTNYIAILLPSPSGVTDCIAEDINDNGMIVGGYSDGSGFSHLVVWTNCLAMAATEINPPPGYQFTALSGHDTPTLDGNGNIACFVSSGTNNNNSNISANPLYPCFIKWDSSSNTWSSSILYTNYLDYNDYLVISPLGKLIASLYGDNQIISWDSPSSPPVFSMPTSMLYSPNTVYSDVFFADDLNHAIGDCSTNNSASYQGAIWDLTKTNSPPTLLPYLSGYSDNQAHSMNHNGWIVGWANGNQTITPRPILWTNTSDLPVALKIPSSAKFGVVFSVNDSNQIVGIESNGNQMCALIYSGTNMAFLPIKSGYTQSAAVKINAHGFIAGAIVTSNNQSKGCVWAPIATPTVTFTQPTTPVVYAAGKTFSLSATSTSGGTITYSSSNTNVVSVSGSTATIKGVGTATLTATVAATANFTSASAARNVTVR